MPQFDPTWFPTQIFWLAITFLLLYALVAKFLLPPVLEVLERRAATIENDLKSAETMKVEAKSAKENYERALTEARAKSQSLIDGVMTEHKTLSEAASREMEGNIAAKIKQAEVDISTKKKALLDSLVPTTSEMASLIVAKVAGGKA